MSATNRKKKRVLNDQYNTPSWAVDRLLDKIFLPGGLWLEPMAGEGNIIKAVNNHQSKMNITWDACELDSTLGHHLRPLTRELHLGDFFDQDLSHNKYKVIIGNPAYNVAMKTIDHCLELEPDYLVFLLRTSFLESAKRNHFMKHNTPDIYLLPDRPKFVYNRSDNCSYSWMVWSRVAKTSGQLHILDCTPQKERACRKA